MRERGRVRSEGEASEPRGIAVCQVDASGRSWRSGAVVEQRHLPQVARSW